MRGGITTKILVLHTDSIQQTQRGPGLLVLVVVRIHTTITDMTTITTTTIAQDIMIRGERAGIEEQGRVQYHENTSGIGSETANETENENETATTIANHTTTAIDPLGVKMTMRAVQLVQIHVARELETHRPLQVHPLRQLRGRPHRHCPNQTPSLAHRHVGQLHDQRQQRTILVVG